LTSFKIYGQQNGSKGYFLVQGGLDNIGDWFHDFGNKIVDWKGWRDMGDFFGKIDNWFQDAKNSLVNWKGFSDMANFFGSMLFNLFYVFVHCYTRYLISKVSSKISVSVIITF
jgi:hypothetical protein